MSVFCQRYTNAIMKEDINDSADIARQGFYHSAEVPKNFAQIFLTYSRWSIFFVVFFSKDVEHLQKIHTMPG